MADQLSAYELADDAKNISNTIEALEFVQKAVPMLRQQANELDKVVPQLVKANGLIENLRLRIAELEKDLHMIQRHYDQLDTQLHPQTKPLSVEEIWEIYKSWTRWIDGGYELQVVHFARAIEERHGIK